MTRLDRPRENQAKAEIAATTIPLQTRRQGGYMQQIRIAPALFDRGMGNDHAFSNQSTGWSRRCTSTTRVGAGDSGDGGRPAVLISSHRATKDKS